MTYPVHPALHDWENWDDASGRNGYTAGAKHQSGVMIYQNENRVDMGTHCVYSGKTLTRINQMYNVNSMDVLKHHIESGHNIARIDIALDFFGGSLTVEDFQQSFLRGEAITKLRSASVIKSLTDRGHTFYIGSKKRRKKLVRIYDKSAEQNWDFNCIRVEVQLMGKPATKTSIEAVRGESVGKVLLGSIKDVIDFPLITEWNTVMETSDSIQIGTEYEGVGDTKKWLEESVRMCLIRQAVLDLNWWTQYKLDIDTQVEVFTERIVRL